MFERHTICVYVVCKSDNCCFKFLFCSTARLKALRSDVAAAKTISRSDNEFCSCSTVSSNLDNRTVNRFIYHQKDFY